MPWGKINRNVQAAYEQIAQAVAAHIRAVDIAPALPRFVEAMRETLQLIANANPRNWQELAEPMGEFERWSKARALQALASHATPAVAVEPMWMCNAYGESDFPSFQFAYSRSDVVEFLCNEWLGCTPAEAENEPAFTEFMEQFDAPDWDMVDHVSLKFEIGGIVITRLCHAALALTQLGIAVQEMKI